jgi:outer membrane protein
MSMTAQAQSLLELYNAARSYDASFQSAKSQFDATSARADQAQSLLLPTVGLQANANRTSQEVSPVPERAFGSQTISIGATQPLYRPASVASYKQGKTQLPLAQAQLLAAEQDLIVRVSQAYFDVLASTDSLTFVKSQKTAVAEQLASAKRNFEVGTSTITGQRDAQARYDLVVAQELSAESDLLIKTIALNQLVGKTNASPKPIKAPVQLMAVEPANIDHWVTQAEDKHPGIKQFDVALEVAKLETEKAYAGHKPTVDLTGSYATINNEGVNGVGINNRINQAAIGINVTVPLFAGFAVQNRVKETLSLEDKARTDLEATKRTVAQGTRTAFYGVQSGLALVKALEAAEISTQSALDSNKLGYQVGVNINIDVLNSQSQLFDTKAKLAKARYDVLVGGLKLRQASGVLSEADLQVVNSQLAP